MQIFQSPHTVTLVLIKLIGTIANLFNNVQKLHQRYVPFKIKLVYSLFTVSKFKIDEWIDR